MSEQRWPAHLVVVRHGQSERNVRREAARQKGDTDFFHGGLRDLDAPLTACGVEQARLTGVELAPRYRFDVAFSSPHLRSRQTLATMAKAWPEPIPVLLDERVREIEFGSLDGLTWQGIRHRYPEEYARREREGKYWYRPPGGESRPDVALRVQDFISLLTHEHADQNVLVICHSVVVLIFRRLLEHWDEAQYLEIDSGDEVQNCSVTAYRYDPARRRLRLECYNQVCYQPELPAAELGVDPAPQEVESSPA